MRLLVAPDSFGGTLSAVEAAEAIAVGWRRVAPAADVDLVPISDGGPGFVDVLHTSLGGELHAMTVPGPLGEPIEAAYLTAEGTAYVESAQAAGLHLVAGSARDPLRATTLGVGRLLVAAVASDVRRVVVGLGGSATNDGGAGLLAGVGMTFRFADGAELPPGGAALADLDHIDARTLTDLTGVELLAATDVDNPLLGLHGASSVFGPQKGASPQDVERLDVALAHFADVLERDWHAAASRDAPGAGAAGGMGYALFALGATRESGIDLVLEATRLAARVAASDLVVTGEGSFDSQSLRGKAASGVARAAVAAGVPCVVLAGQVSLGRGELAAAGVDAAYSVADAAGSVAAAMARPAAELTALAERVARTWSGRPS